MRESPFSGLVIRFGQFLQELSAISLRESYFQSDFSFDPYLILFFVPPSTGKYRIVVRKAFAVLRGQILDIPKHGNI